MSRFDVQWDANEGDAPIHYVPDMAKLNGILRTCLIRPPAGIQLVYATLWRDFPPGGRVVTDVIGKEVVAGIEIHEATGWITTLSPNFWIYIGDVAFTLHPTLPRYQDKYGRGIVPVVQK